jgi:hypothetical protein
MKNILNLKKVGLMVPLFLCITAWGQENVKGFNFTPRVGMAFSYAGHDNIDTRSFKLCPDGGVELKLDLGKHFSITSGVYYAQKAKYYSSNNTVSFFSALNNSFFGGTGIDTVIKAIIGPAADFINDSIYTKYSGKTVTHYIQIPLMATIDIKNFSVSAGGYLGIKLSASATEVMTQNFPMYNTFESTFTDPSIAPFMNFFLAGYPALNGPVTSQVHPDFIASTDYGLAFEIAGRFDDHFKMSSSVFYGLSNYSTNATAYPGKNFTINFNFGVTFGKIKGTKVSAKLF